MDWMDKHKIDCQDGLVTACDLNAIMERCHCANKRVLCWLKRVLLLKIAPIKRGEVCCLKWCFKFCCLTVLTRSKQTHTSWTIYLHCQYVGVHYIYSKRKLLKVLREPRTMVCRVCHGSRLCNFSKLIPFVVNVEFPRLFTIRRNGLMDLKTTSCTCNIVVPLGPINVYYQELVFRDHRFDILISVLNLA